MILIILAAQIILYSLTIYNENLSYTSTYAYIWQIVVQVPTQKFQKYVQI